MGAACISFSFQCHLHFPKHALKHYLPCFPNHWIGGKIQLRPNIANLGVSKVKWEIEDLHGVSLWEDSVKIIIVNLGDGKAQWEIEGFMVRGWDISA